MPEPSYGIVFSGGGSFGAWEVGCYQAIKSRHRGIPPLVVTGASAGALNAAGVCATMDVERLTQLWSGLRNDDVYRNNLADQFALSRKELFKLIFSSGRIDLALQIAMKFLDENKSIFDASPLQATLHDIFKPAVWQSFQQSPTYFAISLTNLQSKKKEVFFKLPVGETLSEAARRQQQKTIWTQLGASSDLLVQALMGSTALPILFPPFGVYFDGGVLLNQPISPAIAMADPKILYVVIPTAIALGVTNNIKQIGATVLETWLSASLIAQIEKIQLRNKIKTMSNSGAGEGENDTRTRICVIRPPSDLERIFNMNLLTFGQSVRQMIAAGADAANARLDIFDYQDENTWYDR